MALLAVLTMAALAMGFETRRAVALQRAAHADAALRRLADAVAADIPSHVPPILRIEAAARRREGDSRPGGRTGAAAAARQMVTDVDEAGSIVIDRLEVDAARVRLTASSTDSGPLQALIGKLHAAPHWTSLRPSLLVETNSARLTLEATADGSRDRMRQGDTP